MNALQQIIEELSDCEKSLAGPLLKTKILASRIKNQEIMEWASRELVGYRDISDLPVYRYVRPVYQWQIRQRGTELPLAPVPRMLFDSEIQELYFRGRIDSAVEVLEAVTRRSNGDTVMGKEYAADICKFLSDKIKNNAQLNISILRLTSTIDVSEVVQVLANIRSMLLDFMLKLESDVPELAIPLNQVVPVSAAEESKITQIFHHTMITVTGDGNTVVAGESNSVSEL